LNSGASFLSSNNGEYNVCLRFRAQPVAAHYVQVAPYVRVTIRSIYVSMVLSGNGDITLSEIEDWLLVNH